MIFTRFGNAQLLKSTNFREIFQCIKDQKILKKQLHYRINVKNAKKKALYVLQLQNIITLFHLK